MKVELQTCRVVRKETADACGKPATRLIYFGDKSFARACEACALELQQVAESHGTHIGIATCE